MDQTVNHHKNCCKPEMGRGCSFCDCGSECEALPCEGCFKLHETSWLEDYPVNLPSDIVEVRFKNTRRSFYQNVNHLDLKRGDIVAARDSPPTTASTRKSTARLSPTTSNAGRRPSPSNTRR